MLVTARDEAGLIAATLAGLREAFPTAALWVADDGSRDRTAAIASAAGASVVSCGRPLGKGGAATLAAEAILAAAGATVAATGAGASFPGVVVLCDADLGRSAARLAALQVPLARGEADVAVASFARRLGGGFGIALRFARRSVRRRCGLAMQAPLSGQRAIRLEALPSLLPFAHGFGMEVGISIDGVRSGLRVVEVEIDLEHRVTGRTVSGFLHRARQLLHVARADLARRRDRPRDAAAADPPGGGGRPRVGSKSRR